MRIHGFTLTLVTTCLLGLAGCRSEVGPAPIADDDWYQRQERQYQRHLDKADEQAKRLDSAYDRADAQEARVEKLIERWEKQADRFDQILDRWERQPVPPQ